MAARSVVKGVDDRLHELVGDRVLRDARVVLQKVHHRVLLGGVEPELDGKQQVVTGYRQRTCPLLQLNLGSRQAKAGRGPVLDSSSLAYLTTGLPGFYPSDRALLS